MVTQHLYSIGRTPHMLRHSSVIVAFREKGLWEQSNAKVQIVIFDQEQWRTDLQQLLLLAPPFLNLSIGEFMAIENERMIPQQQPASTLCSVDDIEAYINGKKSESKNYLWAIDMPLVERATR